MGRGRIKNATGRSSFGAPFFGAIRKRKLVFGDPDLTPLRSYAVTPGEKILMDSAIMDLANPDSTKKYHKKTITKTTPN